MSRTVTARQCRPSSIALALAISPCRQALGAGWRTLYVPAGPQTITARLTPYPDLVQDIDILASGVLRVDLDFAEPKPGDRLFKGDFESVAAIRPH